MPKTKKARRPIAYAKLSSNVANTALSKRKEAFNVKKHSYCVKDRTATQSPTKAKLRKRLKNFQQKLRRRNLKTSSLTGLIKDMRNRKLLEKVPADQLTRPVLWFNIGYFSEPDKKLSAKTRG